MIANAEQAIRELRHKRTGELLPSKAIARNTRLVYLDDEMIGLRFHDTIIAKYLSDHVVIDTRDSTNPQGWFSQTTWERIDRWTPARTYTRNGLRYVMLDATLGWDGPSRLYAHGTKVFPNGSCEIPLEQAQSDAIEAVKRNMPRRLRRYANRVVDLWRNWQEPSLCCLEIPDDGPWLTHVLEHVKSNDPVVPPDFEDDFIMPGRHARLQGDRLCRQIAEDYEDHLKRCLIPRAIEVIAPGFPYPQLEKRAQA